MEGEGEGVRGSVKLKVPVRWRPAKKCSAVGINKFCIIIKHQGIGILRLRLSDMDFLGFFKIS